MPVVQRAKEMGKKVIIMGQNPGFSKGLQRAADIVIDITKPQTTRYNRSNNYNKNRNTYPKKDFTNVTNLSNNTNNNNKTKNDAPKK